MYARTCFIAISLTIQLSKMLHIFSENARGRYNPLDNTRNPRLCTLSIHGIRFAVLLSLYSILLILLSFVAGRFSINDRSLPTIPCTISYTQCSFFNCQVKALTSSCVLVHTKTKIFHYDPRFGAVPSNASNAIWQSIFPAQGGFFKHPTLAPKRSAFSVFHQLHCLVSQASSID